MPYGDFTKPIWIKDGVLPRKSLFGKLKGVPVLADVVPTIPQSDWGDIIASANKPEMSSAVWNVYDQDGVGSCFVPGTPIVLATGEMLPIEQVRVGMPVLTARNGSRTVTTTMSRWHRGALISFSGESGPLFTCTPDHPVLTPLDYREAGNLLPGDVVAVPLKAIEARIPSVRHVKKGKETRTAWLRIEECQLVPYDGPVFNLEVAGVHSYVANGIGVHNCASEGANKAHEIIREMSGRPRIQFNPWFTYHTVSGGRDSGSSLDDNVTFLMNKGSVPESVYPRSKGWRATPPDSAYEAALAYRVLEIFDINTSRSQFELEVGSALLQGFAVYFGYTGHAICGTEMVDTTTARYINSWGQWGDNGFGTIKLSRLQPGYGAFAFRLASEPAA